MICFFLSCCILSPPVILSFSTYSHRRTWDLIISNHCLPFLITISNHSVPAWLGFLVEARKRKPLGTGEREELGKVTPVLFANFWVHMCSYSAYGRTEHNDSLLPSFWTGYCVVHKYRKDPGSSAKALQTELPLERQHTEDRMGHVTWTYPEKFSAKTKISTFSIEVKTQNCIIIKMFRVHLKITWHVKYQRNIHMKRDKV